MRRATGDRGATLIEYALIVALIFAVSITAIKNLETKGTSKVDAGAIERGKPTEQLFLPSSSGVIIGGGSGSSVGSGSATVQVASIEGSGGPGKTPSVWDATVTVSVEDIATSNLWSGVTVTGTWSYLEGATPKTATGTCQTTSSGLCPITLSGLSRSGAKATLSVSFDNIVLSGTGITHSPPSPDPSGSGPIFQP